MSILKNFFEFFDPKSIGLRFEKRFEFEFEWIFRSIFNYYYCNIY